MSTRIIENNITIGYDVINILNNKRSPFLRTNGNTNPEKIGRFKIIPAGLQDGLRAIAKAVAKNRIIVIDEVGKLELNGSGWANEIEKLLNKSNKVIVMSVRESFVEDVIKKWKFEPVLIYHVATENYKQLLETIIGCINEPYSDHIEVNK